MEMIALIISGLALLAASGCLYLLGKEKKRNEKQKTDVCNYADACLQEAKSYALKLVNDALLEISGRFTTEELGIQAAVDEKISEAVFIIQNRLMEEITEAVGGVSNRVEKLEKGIVPDYEKAMAAADAVNSFNQGITNILGFDPKEALIEQRNRERTGDPL